MQRRRRVPLLALVAGLLAVGAPPAAAQSPSPSPSPSFGPSPNCVSYSASTSTTSAVAGSTVFLYGVIHGNGNYDHEVKVQPEGYTRRPGLTDLAQSDFTREPGGGLPGGNGDTSARWSFRPTTSSRVWVSYADRCHDGQERTGETERILVVVAPRLTLTAVRHGPRNYTFSGEAVSRPGQTLSLYRIDAHGREVLTSQTQSTDDGTWSLRRTFLGSGEFPFVLRTKGDQANAPGESNTRPTVIH